MAGGKLPMIKIFIFFVSDHLTPKNALFEEFNVPTVHPATSGRLRNENEDKTKTQMTQSINILKMGPRFGAKIS